MIANKITDVGMEILAKSIMVNENIKKVFLNSIFYIKKDINFSEYGCSIHKINDILTNENIETIGLSSMIYFY
jgi:hypothetical protein